MDAAAPASATPARAEAPHAPPAETEAAPWWWLPYAPLAPQRALTLRNWPVAALAAAREAQESPAAADSRGAPALHQRPAPALQHPPQAAPAASYDGDGDGDDMEEVVPQMPRPSSLIGRRVAFRHARPSPRGSSAVTIGVIDAALPPSGAHDWRFRVRFRDYPPETVSWPKLHSCLVKDDSDSDSDGQPAAQPAAPTPTAAPAPVLSAPMAAPAPAAPVPAPAAVDDAEDDEQAAGPMYRGVSAALDDPTLFRIETRDGGKRVTVTGFATAEEAARAYDDGRRRRGLRVVNFPRPGTNEVQAVPGEQDLITLRRVEPDAGHCRVPSRRAPRSAAEAPPMALRSRAPAAVGTPAAAAPAAATAAASPLASPADPLIGQRVRVPFRSGSTTKMKYGAVMAKRAGGAGYIVRLDDGDECTIDKAAVHKYNVSSTVAADTAAGSPARRQRGARAEMGRGNGGAGAGGGAGGAAVPYRGVWKSLGCFRAALCISRNDRTMLGDFPTIEAAARAVDVAARKAGALHLLNFPQTTAERAAVAEWVKRPPVAAALARREPAAKPAAPKRSGEAARTAAGAAPKRKRVSAPTPSESDGEDAAAPPEQSPERSGTPVPDGEDDRAPAPAAAPAAAPIATPAPAPSGAPAPAPPAAAAEPAGVEAVAAFLRGISRPLQDIDVILAALRATSLTMAGLSLLPQHAASKGVFKQLREDVFETLRVTRFDDQLKLTAALATLAPPRQA